MELGVEWKASDVLEAFANKAVWILSSETGNVSDDDAVPDITAFLNSGTFEIQEV